MLAFVRGYTPSEKSGRSLRQHVLLADGRLVAIIDDWRNGDVLASTVLVSGPRGGEDMLGSDCGEVANLRVEGDVVRWTVGGEERSAPLADTDSA